ncbi:MAG: hypothetical protein AAGA32_16575 [Pseudomonadota bacterium]
MTRYGTRSPRLSVTLPRIALRDPEIEQIFARHPRRIWHCTLSLDGGTLVPARCIEFLPPPGLDSEAVDWFAVARGVVDNLRAQGVQFVVDGPDGRTWHDDGSP